MRSETTKKHGLEWVRVNRKEAKACYNAGMTLLVAPVNVNVNNEFFGFYAWFSLSKDNRDFEKLMNEYEYYNCNTSELGRYPKFFVAH